MVLSIILGRTVGWNTQNREADGTSWSDAIRFHAFPTLLGGAWSMIALNISPVFAAWMSPILLGLLLSAPVSVLTSRSRSGKALLRQRILATPEELEPPEFMRLADQAHSAVDAALDASSPARHGVVAAVVDPYVNGVHVSLLEASEFPESGGILAERCLTLGPAGLSQNELSELLYLAPAMLMMHRAVWLRSTDNIHSVWTQAVESYRRRLDQALTTDPS
jgi:membrane glycosyltransferase